MTVALNVGMIVGGLIWLVCELAGVYRNYQAHKARQPEPSDTTSQFVWHAEAHWPILRWLVGLFVASLFFHLLFGTYLLP